MGWVGWRWEVNLEQGYFPSFSLSLSSIRLDGTGSGTLDHILLIGSVLDLASMKSDSDYSFVHSSPSPTLQG